MAVSTAWKRGFWRDRGSKINNCFYAGVTDTANNFTADCLVYAGPDPGAKSFWIQASSPGSTSYQVYIGGYYQRTYNLAFLGITGVHRLDTGYEEQADTLSGGLSQNDSRPADFNTQLYEDSSGNWHYWGFYSHCYVDYSKAESFAEGSGGFPSSHGSAIGAWFPFFPGCDGAAPTSPRSDW